ncbi:unnamed protein product [Plutella xylostella]|uniref:(diamondback moth) hypothetical protein n=1 Tax=Plutella xylostella TaxID=51655 RepID=A0A8S4EV33_PLUXY|nr:unnamed protein product [Plutella xylostella]
MLLPLHGLVIDIDNMVTEAADGTTAYEDEPSPPPEISLYSDQQAILDDAGGSRPLKLPSVVTEADGSTPYEDEPSPPPEISLYSDQQAILDDAG